MSSETPYILTYKDLLDHARDYDAGHGQGDAETAYRSAVQLAYMEIATLRDWNCLWTHGRIDTVAAQSSSTITYTHSTRTVTLASGTFPSWSPYAELRIANVNYEVESNPSSTTLVLSTRRNPGANVAAGTSYVLFRSAYTLPIGFKRMSTPTHQDWYGMEHVLPSEFLHYEKRQYTTGGPCVFTITGSPDLHGQQVLRMWPAPDEAKTLDFFYLRWPRQLKVTGKEAADSSGTITTDGTTTVEGSSACAFSSTRHQGCILRVGSDSNKPSGRHGLYPPLDERSVSSVTDTNTLVVDSAATTATAVAYVLSDPVDLAPYLWELLFRGVEKQLAIRTRDAETIKIADWAWKSHLPYALESDQQYPLNINDVLYGHTTGRVVDTRGS